MPLIGVISFMFFFLQRLFQILSLSVVNSFLTSAASVAPPGSCLFLTNRAPQDSEANPLCSSLPPLISPPSNLIWLRWSSHYPLIIANRCCGPIDRLPVRWLLIVSHLVRSLDPPLSSICNPSGSPWGGVFAQTWTSAQWGMTTHDRGDNKCVFSWQGGTEAERPSPVCCPPRLWKPTSRPVPGQSRMASKVSYIRQVSETHSDACFSCSFCCTYADLLH